MAVKIPIGRSNRHAHLTQEIIEKLFGEGHELTFLRNIRQHDEFVARETIDVRGPKGLLEGVRLLGPARGVAQVELSLSDARSIGLRLYARLSGDVIGTEGVRLVGPCGEIMLAEGAIVALRHIHVSPVEAEKLGLVHGQVVSAQAGGVRSIVFCNIVIRVDPLFTFELHLDTDEFNAAGLKKGDFAELL